MDNGNAFVADQLQVAWICVATRRGDDQPGS
jgi:hypothetical protein